MSIRPSCVPFVLLGLLWLGGCGPAKLDLSESMDLEPGDIKSKDLPAQPKPQTLNVSVASPEEITVAVYKADDAKNLEDLDPKKALARKRGKSERLNVEVPEKTATRVVLSDLNKKAKVELKIDNKK
jgi:hypothetical protein